MPTGHDIALVLRRAYALLHRQTQAVLSQYDMTADQFVLLALLSSKDGVTQAEITLRASSDPNTVRAMLVLLEKKGLVVRRSHDTDRRARKVLITATGRRMYEKLELVLSPLQNALRTPFSEPEASVLVDALQRFCEAIRHWESDQEAHTNK